MRKKEIEIPLIGMVLPLLIFYLLFFLFIYVVVAEAKLITIPKEARMWVEVTVTTKTTENYPPIIEVEGEGSGIITFSPGKVEGTIVENPETGEYEMSGTVNIPGGTVKTNQKTKVKVIKPRAIKTKKLSKKVYAINSSLISHADIHDFRSEIAFYLIDGTIINWDWRGKFDTFQQVLKQLEE